MNYIKGLDKNEWEDDLKDAEKFCKDNFLYDIIFVSDLLELSSFPMETATYLKRFYTHIAGLDL